MIQSMVSSGTDPNQVHQPRENFEDSEVDGTEIIVGIAAAHPDKNFFLEWAIKRLLHIWI